MTAASSPEDSGTRVYIDRADWWIGYYRGPNHHYVCLLPTVVLRWKRKAKGDCDAVPKGRCVMAEDSGAAAPTWHPWPANPVPGTFTLRCTCPEFVHVGDYESMRRAARSHDDSPWTNHIVTIADYQETP